MRKLVLYQQRGRPEKTNQRRGKQTMDRHRKLLSMKDVLDHLGRCYEQWQVADPEADQYLAESIERDLDEFRRLCRSFRQEASSARSRTVVAAA